MTPILEVMNPDPGLNREVRYCGQAPHATSPFPSNPNLLDKINPNLLDTILACSITDPLTP